MTNEPRWCSSQMQKNLQPRCCDSSQTNAFERGLARQADGKWKLDFQRGVWWRAPSRCTRTSSKSGEQHDTARHSLHHIGLATFSELRVSGFRLRKEEAPGKSPSTRQAPQPFVQYLRK